MDDHNAGLRSPDPDDDAAMTAFAREEFSRRPRDIPSVSLLILCVLAIFYTLAIMGELVLPIVMAAMLKMLLQPAMRLLTQRLRLPVLLAALLMVVGLLGFIGAIGFTLEGPAATWIGKAPQSLSVLEQRLRFVRQPIEMFQRTTSRLEALATTHDVPAVTVRDSQLGGLIFRGTRTLLSQFLTLIVMLFFLLAAGDTSLRRLVEILPSFGDKKRAVEIVYEVEHNISIYLVTITLMNLAVGVATGLSMWACGVADPVLWGAVAFLLNYVPILGPLTGIAIFFLVGLLTFTSPWLALLPAGAYLAIHVAEGETITPMLLARRFTLNPVIVIISLFFWYWMWGVPGALLAVPLLATTKIIADRIPTLTPLGHLLGTDGTHD